MQITLPDNYAYVALVCAGYGLLTGVRNPARGRSARKEISNLARRSSSGKASMPLGLENGLGSSTPKVNLVLCST